MKTRPLVVLLALLLSACVVPKKKHEALQAELDQRNAAYAELEKSSADAEEALRAEIAGLQNQIADLEGQRDELQGALAASEGREDALQKKLDDANSTLSMYESKTGGLEAALRATKSDIDELKKQRAAALRRLREYRELAKQLASMIEAGKLSVKVRNGKMVIEMSNAILFDPGKTELKEAGQAALAELAEVLKTVDDRSFLVAGHTDNVPIKVSGYDSNWELSTARANKVLHKLQEAGVEPQRLASAGFGEFDPVASNDTDDGKAQNRRTEIILMPKLDELPELPEDLFATSS